MTGPQIARRLGMPRSTVGAILRRLGLGKLAALEPKPPVVRYERERPGELIHIDTKKLGRIDGVGHCITGDRRSPRRRAGWSFCTSPSTMPPASPTPIGPTAGRSLAREAAARGIGPSRAREPSGRGGRRDGADGGIVGGVKGLLDRAFQARFVPVGFASFGITAGCG
jgi:hypothetical protein